MTSFCLLPKTKMYIGCTVGHVDRYPLSPSFRRVHHWAKPPVRTESSLSRTGDRPVYSQSGDFHGLIGLGSQDGKLKGLGTCLVRLDARVRRLGTSGLLLDTRLDQNLTDWQIGLGLGRTGRRENGSIRPAAWDRTGPGTIEWDYRSGSSLIQIGQSDGIAGPSPAPKLDRDAMLAVFNDSERKAEPSWRKWENPVQKRAGSWGAEV